MSSKTERVCIAQKSVLCVVTDIEQTKYTEKSFYKLLKFNIFYKIYKTYVKFNVSRTFVSICEYKRIRAKLVVGNPIFNAYLCRIFIYSGDFFHKINQIC